MLALQKELVGVEKIPKGKTADIDTANNSWQRNNKNSILTQVKTQIELEFLLKFIR